MALGGLGAVLLSGHPSLSVGHVISQVDLRSVFFAVVFVIIVLVLAYLTNPSETSFRTYLTEQSFKQHLSRLDEGGQEDGVASDDSGVHFTLSRRALPSSRKSGNTFDPTSPFHFVSRASVSLRTPKHVFYSFGILTIAAVYPTGRPHARGHGHALQADSLVSSVSDAWFVGAFGRWWRGGIIQSWWHDMLATRKDAEKVGSGILDVKALDLLESYDGLPLPTSSRLPSDVSGKLRGTERSTARSNNAAHRNGSPPPLPKSASLPLHAPRITISTPPKANGHQVQRHASPPTQTPAPAAPETTRPCAPPMLAYSPSSTSLFDSSPVIAEVLRQISQSKAAVLELRTQLDDYRASASESHTAIEAELEEQRQRKREDDATRTDIKTRTKTLEDSKRRAENSKRDTEKRLRAAESARNNAAARIEKLGVEIGALQTRIQEDESEIVRCVGEGDAQEREVEAELERKKKEIRVAEDVVAALNSRAKELEERIAEEEERLRKAKEQAEIKKQDRSFYPLTVVPTVNEEDLSPPSWSATGPYPDAAQQQALTQELLAHHTSDYAERQETFPQPIQPPRSKGSTSSGSNNSDKREPSVSPRPARLSLTSISNLREPIQRVLPEPDPNGQVLIRPRGFPLFGGDLPSTISTLSTSTRFSPFSDSDDVGEHDAPAHPDVPTTASSISPMSTSLIPTSLITSLNSAGSTGSVGSVGLPRSFQSEDDAVLDRDWRKTARFPAPPPVESPNAARGAYTTSPLSLTCPTFDGVDKEDPFEVRLPPLRRRLTADLVDARVPARTISDPSLPPAGIANVPQAPSLPQEFDIQEKATSAHRRWLSQQDAAAARDRKGLNPEAKAFSLTTKSFPSLFASSQTQLAPSPFDNTYAAPSLPSAPYAPASNASTLSAPPGTDADTVFASVSMRAFAPSPAEREALQRAFGGSANASLERLPTLSEVASIPSVPPSPAHTHKEAMGPGAAGRMLLPPGLSWLQSFPLRKPKFSPWEDEETVEVRGGEGR
ncbi:hypothetical protein C2E23DRAFT_742463 [Lenzites betulinus]|nr:hypothetical protein C2E23DRAFT_742463 [Lenzites betulinus]